MGERERVKDRRGEEKGERKKKGEGLDRELSRVPAGRRLNDNSRTKKKQKEKEIMKHCESSFLANNASTTTVKLPFESACKSPKFYKT